MSAFLIIVLLHIGYDGAPATIILDMPSMNKCEESKAKIIKDLSGEYFKLNTVAAKGTCVHK